MTDLFRAFKDFRRAWPQLVLTDLLFRGIAVVVLAPLVGLLLRLFLASTPSGVLKDEEILQFLLHPTGLAALVIVGAVSLGILFIEQGVLMVVGLATVENRKATYLDALRYMVSRAPRFVELGGRVLLRLLLLALPFLGAIGGIYLLFLREHDINFYLADRPPELRTAILLSGAILAIGSGFVLRQIAAWILSIPMVLFESGGVRRALKASAQATTGRRAAIAWALGSWIIALLALSYGISYTLSLLGGWLLPQEMTDLTVMAVSLGFLLLLSGAGTLLVNVLATTLFALLVVRFYVTVASPEKLGPMFSEPLADRPTFQVPAKWIPAGLLVLLLGIGLAAYASAQSLSATDAAEIIAHRGASGGAPENTMAAFRKAIRDGADWIELDVQENADGTVVVEHDSDFMKVAGVDLKVWNATDQDLSGIDVGSYFDPEFADERVPTLREVLETAKGHLGVFIELKYYGHDRLLESKVVDIVEETGMESNIVVMSLKYEGVRKMAGLRADWTYGLLTTVSIGDLTKLKLNFLAVNATAATRSLIRRAHKRGMKVYVWTVNDPVQMSVMMSRGVDGLITDEPALAGQVKELRADLSPFGRWIVWVAGEMGLLQGADAIAEEQDA